MTTEKEAPNSLTAARAALRLVLLFHNGPWSSQEAVQWLARLREVESATGAALSHEATTRALCDAVRAALSSES